MPARRPANRCSSPAGLIGFLAAPWSSAAPAMAACCASGRSWSWPAGRVGICRCTPGTKRGGSCRFRRSVLLARPAGRNKGRSRPRIYRPCQSMMVDEAGRADALHHSRQAMGEWLLRVLAVAPCACAASRALWRMTGAKSIRPQAQRSGIARRMKHLPRRRGGVSSVMFQPAERIRGLLAAEQDRHRARRGCWRLGFPMPPAPVSPESCHAQGRARSRWATSGSGGRGWPSWVALPNSFSAGCGPPAPAAGSGKGRGSPRCRGPWRHCRQSPA